MTHPNSTVAVVLGRAGSRGLPGKNALELHGRPMVAWTVTAARESSSIEDVVVSTDGDEIAAAAVDAGAHVVRRPAALASDTATVAAAARHAVQIAAPSARTVVILYANVPIRPEGLIDQAVQALHDTGADSVQSYARIGKAHPWWMVELDAAQRVTPCHEAVIDRRQDLPPRWLPDGGVIAVTRASLFGADPSNPHAFLGTDRRGIETEEGTVVDVDTPFDLLVAEAALTRAVAVP